MVRAWWWDRAGSDLRLVAVTGTTLLPEPPVRNRNDRVSRYIPTWPVAKVTYVHSWVASASTGLAPRSFEVDECPGQGRGAGAIRDVFCSQSVTLRYADIGSSFAI